MDLTSRVYENEHAKVLLYSSCLILINEF